MKKVVAFVLLSLALILSVYFISNAVSSDDSVDGIYCEQTISQDFVL